MAESNKVAGKDFVHKLKQLNDINLKNQMPHQSMTNIISLSSGNFTDTFQKYNTMNMCLQFWQACMYYILLDLTALL